MSEQDLIKAIKELTDELKKHHEKEKGKRWYAKAPFKDILAHGTTLCLAVVIGLMVHFCTGDNVTIQAFEESRSAPAFTAAPNPPAPSSWEEELVKMAAEQASAIARSPVPSASVAVETPLPPKAKKAKAAKMATVGSATALALAPAPPTAAPSSSAPSILDYDSAH